MDIQAICDAHWTSKPAQLAASEMVRDFLAGAPSGSSFSTTKLMQSMGIDPELRTKFAGKLAGARSNGYLESEVDFIYGKPNHATFGKPSIQWIALV